MTLLSGPDLSNSLVGVLNGFRQERVAFMSVLSLGRIDIQFVGLSGRKRQPIAHTTGPCLDLPNTYSSHRDLRMEWDAILTVGASEPGIGVQWNARLCTCGLQTLGHGALGWCTFYGWWSLRCGDDAGMVHQWSLATCAMVWYLPNHGVIHPQKDKLRVVLDASARFAGTSLNDSFIWPRS